MSSTDNNNDNKTAWGPDTNSLEDWLENDLKQSTLFHQRRKQSSTKYSLSHIIIQDTSLQQQKYEAAPIEEKLDTIKGEQQTKQMAQQQQQQQDNKSLPTHLIPLIKVYSLLNTIRQNEQMAKENKLNQMHNIPTSAPPSPIMSVDGSIDNHQQTITKNKRGNNRAPVDLIVKRQRNTDAARRSRLRKAIKMETLEKQVETLKTDNERLRVRVAVLESEVCHATEKEQRNRQRVLELEAQLANAHKQLVEEYKK